MAQRKTTAQGRATTSRTSAASAKKRTGTGTARGSHAASPARRTASARANAPKTSSRPATRRVASTPVAPVAPRPGLLDMQTHHDIAGVIVGIVGVALLIAVLTPTTGLLTAAVSNALHALLGVGAVIVPIALVLWGIAFFVQTDRIMPGRAAVGLGLVALAIISLLGITTPGAVENPSVLFNAYVLADRGGYVGNGLAWALLEMTGKPIGIVVLVGLILAGIIVIGFSVTQAIDDLVLHVRERRAWSRLQAQERAAQHVRDQQQGWFGRTGAQVPADYAPTALFDPNRPLSSGVEQEADAATSVIRPATTPRSRAARSFGCGDAPLGESAPIADANSATPAETPLASPTTDVRTTMLAGGAPQSGAFSDQADAAVPESTNTTFLQSDDVRETYDYLSNASAPESPDPVPALDATWWDDDPEDDVDGLLAGEDRERELADGPVPVPGVIAGAPRTLADFGLDESDFEEGEPTQDASPVEPAAPAAPDVRPGRAARAASRVTALTTETLAKNAAIEQARAPRCSTSDAPEEGLPWEDAPVPDAKAGGVRVAPNPDAARPARPFELPDPAVLKRNPHGLRRTKEQEADIARTGTVLQQTLNEFRVKADVVDWVYGPTCTTYEVSPGEGVRVNKFTSLEDDIARALATESVRIYAPVPGTSYVGIEVPNRERQAVCFGDVLPYVDGGPLDFAVGLDANGKPVHVDLAKLPHLLVAGTTGSGKSVMVNSIVMSMLMRATPDDVRLIMVDPKQVEFKDYDGIPHLIMPVVTDMRQAAAALQWGVTEMDRRYRVFSNLGVRDLKGYNALVDRGALADQEFPLRHLPSVVMIVDELADLMMVAKKDVEASIVRIAQLGRAAGVHLVLATQSPRADVVTGLIRANVACRAGLKVSKGTDSQIAIDQRGAEKLLGHGDMLFLQTAWGDKPRRIQGCYLTDGEISAVVEHLKAQAAPDYDTGMAPLGAVNGQMTMDLPGADSSANPAGETDLNDDDPLAWQAAQLVVENQLGSTSMIQRRLKLGYARAGRVMDMLEEMGVVGPARGSKPRDVLVRDMDELATIRGTHSFEEEY